MVYSMFFRMAVLPMVPGTWAPW